MILHTCLGWYISQFNLNMHWNIWILSLKFVVIAFKNYWKILKSLLHPYFLYPGTIRIINHSKLFANFWILNNLIIHIHTYKYLIYRICLLCSIDRLPDCPCITNNQYKLRISVPNNSSLNRIKFLINK